jgi:hypothetical protein
MSACFRLRFGDGRYAPAPFLCLCACAPLSRSPNRRPKPCKTYLNQRSRFTLFYRYLGMAKNQFSDADAEIISILAKERALQDELERARKNN